MVTSITQPSAPSDFTYNVFATVQEDLSSLLTYTQSPDCGHAMTFAYSWEFKKTVGNGNEDAF